MTATREFTWNPDTITVSEMLTTVPKGVAYMVSPEGDLIIDLGPDHESLAIRPGQSVVFDIQTDMTTETTTETTTDAVRPD